MDLKSLLTEVVNKNETSKEDIKKRNDELERVYFNKYYNGRKTNLDMSDNDYLSRSSMKCETKCGSILSYRSSLHSRRMDKFSHHREIGAQFTLGNILGSYPAGETINGI